MRPPVKRIEHDVNDIKAGDCEFIVDIELLSGDSLIVKAIAVGPISIFKDDTFEVTMRFSENYPYSPPKMEIVAAINHHVAQSIEESMNILLQADWKPVQTIQDILDIMLCLLYQNESRESA